MPARAAGAGAPEIRKGPQGPEKGKNRKRASTAGGLGYSPSRKQAVLCRGRREEE